MKPGKTLTDDELRRTIVVILDSGEVLASRDGFVTFDVMFTLGTVRPEYGNVMAMSVMLYTTLFETREALDAAVALMEKSGADAVAAPFVGMIASIDSALKMAVEGPNAILARKVEPPQPAAIEPKRMRPPQPPKKKPFWRK